MQKRLTRAEVPVEQTWNLEDLFPSVAAWEDALTHVEDEIAGVAQYKGRLGEGAAVMLACLTAFEKLMERFMRVAVFANLKISEDGSSPANQGLAARSGALNAKVGAGTAFLRSEILALPEGTIGRYRSEEPALAAFKVYLSELEDYKPHVLAPDTEVALAALGEVTGAPYTIYNRAKSSDMAFEPIVDDEGNSVPVSFAMYEEKLEMVPSVEIRRKAFASFAKGLSAYKNTLAATFATEVKKNVVTARLRKFESATHMLLQPQQVPTNVYNNVLDVIQTELAPHMRRYANLRKRVLGLDKLLYCDIEAPLDPAYNPAISYDEASKLIEDALSVMGPEYMETIHNALTRRWVDRADNVGKSTGAFCSSPYGVHPYILVTWADNMRGAFVLAHELGHAGHFGLAMKYQRLVNLRPSMFFIEAPSTINELILGDYITARSTDKRMRRWVSMSLLATYHHNFVRHLLEGELQRRIYALAEAGKPVTESTLSGVKGEILSQFWADSVVIDDAAKLTWMRQPHYYMGLYPYTYAAGLTTATAVAQMIKEEGQPAVDRWLKVLKAGGTMKPLELMATAGVDMSKPDPLRKAVAFVGGLVDDLEKSF